MKGAAWRVGLFALVGLGLLALAVVLAGGHWFVARESALMRFTTSVYGLQAGAPVVFRGVRVGQVTSVELSPAAPGGQVVIPVAASFERALMRNLLEPGVVAGDGVLPVLISRGLVAKLKTQSLLTGQLYIELDLEAPRAAAPATPASVSASVSAPVSASAPAAAPAPVRLAGLPVIPTGPSPLQSLQAQAERLDLAQIGADLGGLLASARQLVGGPEAARLLTRINEAAAALERVAQRLEREVGPLARSANAALGEGQRAAAAVGQGATQMGQSAQQMAAQVGSAASQAERQIGAMSGAGTQALAQVQRSAEAVAAAADALRLAAGDESTLRVNADRALQDVSQAARALRELAELLERHPEAVLRGRTNAP